MLAAAARRVAASLVVVTSFAISCLVASAASRRAAQSSFRGALVAGLSKGLKVSWLLFMDSRILPSHRCSGNHFAVAGQIMHGQVRQGFHLLDDFIISFVSGGLDQPLAIHLFVAVVVESGTVRVQPLTQIVEIVVEIPGTFRLGGAEYPYFRMVAIVLGNYMAIELLGDRLYVLLSRTSPHFTCRICSLPMTSWTCF